MNLNKEITVDMILKLRPCGEWTREKVLQYIGPGKTLLDIGDLEKGTRTNLRYD